MTTPAGWYRDPAGSPRQRWWDGRQWTDSFSEPYGASAVALKAPEGTLTNTLWIWLVVFVPYLTLPFLFTWDLPGMFANLDYSDPSSAERLQLEMFTSPAFLIFTVLGWVAAAAVILFSYLDWKYLVAVGVPKPFHWAFAFFSLAGYPVYAIGRAVVVHRRTGKGLAVMWATIAMIVLSFVVAMVWAGYLITSIFATVPFS